MFLIKEDAILKDKVALISDSGQTVTYSEVQNFSNEMRGVINERSLVFCLCKNSIGSLLGYISFLSNRIVPLMISADIDSESLEQLLNIYTPNYIWLPSEKLTSYQQYKVVYSVKEYSLIEYSSEVIDLNQNLALLLTTSGSTGSPKLVRLSYANLISNAESIAEYLDLTDQERPITSLPMHYSYGLSVINSHIIKGATILLTDASVAQKDFWNFAKNERATSIAGVPYTYEMLRRLRFFKMDLPDLKTMTQAGGKLLPELVSEFADYASQTNRSFVVMYGQTEATARMSYLPSDYVLKKNASIGIAIPGGQFYIIDNKGNKIDKTDVDGELIYKGDNVCFGYAEKKEDLNKQDDNLGVLHTGDIAFFDNDGFYYITGRMKRFIKIYGNRVNLDEAEQIVKKITLSCACVGCDDKMIVYITDDNLCAKVKTLLSDKTGLNSRAFDVRFISEIPQSSSGKVLYSKLENIE